MDKRAFYSQTNVSDTYDRLRFGGAGGARVNARELEMALELIPERGTVLDLACGTGRLSQALSGRGQPVFALDYSQPMARKTADLSIRTTVGDGFSAPFGGGSFDAVVALRFAFHYPDLMPLLAEMLRLMVNGGVAVFDTYVWSPRAMIALSAQRWGGRVHIHSRRRVRAMAIAHGFNVEREWPCFLFSPYLYRLVPLSLERALESFERRVPAAWLCRTFWQLRK